MKRLMWMAICVLIGLHRATAEVVVTSPDGSLQISVDVRDFRRPFPQGKHLAYSIRYRGREIVAFSPVRLDLDRGAPIGRGVEIVDIQRWQRRAVTELLYGENRYLRDFCNGATLTLREQTGGHRLYYLDVRAYNRAVAFRLRLPRQPSLTSFVVTKERTFVRLAAGTAYALILKGFHTPYETNYQVKQTSEFETDALIGLPLLVGVSGGPWVAISEADLEDYAGMYLSAFAGERGTFVSRLSPLPDSPDVCARLETPFSMPWRLFMVADHPGQLIGSDVILALNEPSQIERPCWIQPGKVAWPWWSGRTVVGRDFKGGMNTATMKYYIDFAADAGLQYLLIDAGWYGRHDDVNADITRPIPEIDLPGILRYAQAKNVGVLLWVNWRCVERQMNEAFALYEKWGVKGIKVDYMNRDDQEMVRFYRRVVQKAAEHHLVVDFHGAYKPTGLRRTFPNLLTREGVLGLEYSKWSTYCSPEHELHIPFIRMLVGPMDFTPGAFNVGTRETFRGRAVPPMALGTRAHQLAMYVVYYSPLQMLVDHPESYWGQPGFEFLKAVPTVWDETRFVEGDVGNYIVLARRSGEEWYLGAMTDWTPRDLRIPLSFLGKGHFIAEIYADGPEADRKPTQVAVLREEVIPDDTLRVRLASGGGCAVRFLPTWAK
jgi:alpha-glucosidase